MIRDFSFRTLFALGALALLTGGLAACAGEEEGAPLQPSVQDQPPAAPYETIPVIQDPQQEIWRPGYWELEHGLFVWVPGKVIHRPSPTAVWSGAHWMHHNYGWAFVEGHWE